MKIIGCTSNRADYDLLSSLYLLLKEDPDCCFKLIVSGAHLSEHYGYSINQINNDGFDILCKIDSIKNCIDNKASRIKTTSNLLAEIIDPIDNFSPDLIIFAGDREDVIIYSMVGIYLDIPTIHFYSGDHAKDGYVDNPIRHATSKLASAHFVCIKEHAKRLIAMGEHPKRIFQIGSIALDKFSDFKPLDMETIKNTLKNKTSEIRDNYCMLIFHPIGDQVENSPEKFINILKSLEKLNIFTFVNSPNTDPNNQKLRNIIKSYKYNENFLFFDNLNRDVFLSIYKNCSFLIGNSSSGIHEAATIPIPVINIGQRQRGRYAKNNVIFIDGSNCNQIIDAIKLVTTVNFRNTIKNMKNPYGDGHSAIKAFQLIKSIDFKQLLQKPEDPLEVNNE